jgi:ABC-type ATPase involved in cell division
MVPAEDVPKLFAWAQANGLALFPIPKFCKRPTGIVRSHAMDWSRDPWQWRRWYDENGGCNFGVACGPSRIVVVDIDTDGNFPYRREYDGWSDGYGTPTVVTPTRGEHFYYRVGDEVDAASLRQPDIVPTKVNVRAGRGYVVSPWSVTDRQADAGVKANGQYLLNHMLPSGFWPIFPNLLAHCAPERDDGARIVATRDVPLADDGLPVDVNDRHYVIGKANVVLEPLRRAAPGERNDQLNRAAFAVGKIVAEGMLAEGAAEAMLWDAAAQCGIPRDEAKARSTVRSGMRAAPRVGRPEPRSAMAELLACDIPVLPFTRPTPFVPRQAGPLAPPEPLVERLLYEGEITLLSGGSGSGKTTLAASLAAASTTDVRDFQFGDFAAGSSDVLMRPCAWVFVSYEGGQHVDRNVAAWHKGVGVAARRPERFATMVVDDGPLVGSVKREAVVRQQQAEAINAAIDATAAACGGLPVVLVMDNATAAVEDSTDNVQVQLFMRSMRTIARRGVAILLLGHPPKGNSSAVYGSHVFFSLSDTVGVLEVLRREDGEWTQWVDFPKHRVSPNGKCIEVKSRRLLEPLIALPPDWGAGNERARERQIRDLHVPYARVIKVRNASDRQAAASGVVEQVSAKQSSSLKL